MMDRREAGQALGKKGVDAVDELFHENPPFVELRLAAKRNRVRDGAAGRRVPLHREAVWPEGPDGVWKAGLDRCKFGLPSVQSDSRSMQRTSPGSFPISTNRALSRAVLLRFGDTCR
jgi:hypothetical protein